MDSTTMLMLVAIALLVLKPDLLTGLFGGRGSSGGGSTVPGPVPYPVIMTPPEAWKAAGMGDGSGRNPANPAMPIGWKPGDPTWNKVDLGTPAVEAFNAAHPCPPGQQYNTISGQCQPLGVWVSQSLPPGPTPQPPQARPAPPAAVFEVKSSNYRDAKFTPFSGA